MAAESFESLLARGQSMLEELFPGVLVYAGDTYACVNSGSRNESELEEGGFVSSGTRQVRVSKSAMVTAPALGSVMVLDGVDVRCVGVGEREWDVAWHLELEPERA